MNIPIITIAPSTIATTTGELIRILGKEFKMPTISQETLATFENWIKIAKGKKEMSVYLEVLI